MNAALQSWMADTGLEALSDWPRPLAYALAALLCALLGSSEALAQRTPRNMRQLWLRLCPFYLLVAASAVVHGDVLWVQGARAFAHAHDAYDQRRVFQLASLLLLGLLAASYGKHYRSQAQATRASASRSLLLAGAGGTLLVFLLRYVSFHYTDLVINAQWLDHSVASWLELASLGLVGLASTVELLRSYGHV